MGRTAVAVADSSALPRSEPRPNPDPKVEAQLAGLSKQLGYGRHFRPGWRHLALILLIVAASWVVVSFGRTITQLNAATDRQAQPTTETAALTERLQAEHRELDLVQTDGYQAMQARAFGIGAPGETAFSLEEGAPEPQPVIPLGARPAATQAQTPLDAWLQLLFGD